MAAFPTTSTHIIEVKSKRYDVAQLSSALTSALKNQINTRESIHTNLNTHVTADDLGASASTLFHLHTLTTDITIHPPTQTIRYARETRPNPEYDVFQSLKQKLCEESEPLTPLNLVSATERLIRSPVITLQGAVKNRRTHDDTATSVFLFLPSSHASKPLVQLPALPSQIASEWNAGSKAWDLQHWLHAALSLDPKETASRKAHYRDESNRFHLKTTLQLIWVPADNGGIDIKLMLTIDVLVDMPALFTPLHDVGPDLVGLVLYSLLPASVTARSSSVSENKVNALRTFFDCLEPAPDHPMTFNSRQLQPDDLMCKLYPFQARTLGLLLQRERAPMVKGVDTSSLDPLGFWQAYELGEEGTRIAYRRSTGTVVQLQPKHKPVDRKGKGRAIEVDDDRADGFEPGEIESLPRMLDLSTVRGTMLCEEMGKRERLSGHPGAEDQVLVRPWKRLPSLFFIAIRFPLHERSLLGISLLLSTMLKHLQVLRRDARNPKRRDRSRSSTF